MERSIEEIIEDNEEISQDTVDTEEQPIEEPVVAQAIQRPKKERSQKQKEALEKARVARTRNIAAKKAQKSELTSSATQKTKKPKKQPKVIIINIRKFIVLGRRGPYSHPP